MATTRSMKQHSEFSKFLEKQNFSPENITAIYTRFLQAFDLHQNDWIIDYMPFNFGTPAVESERLIRFDVSLWIKAKREMPQWKIDILSSIISEFIIYCNSKIPIFFNFENLTEDDLLLKKREIPSLIVDSSTTSTSTASTSTSTASASTSTTPVLPFANPLNIFHPPDQPCLGDVFPMTYAGDYPQFNDLVFSQHDYPHDCQCDMINLGDNEALRPIYTGIIPSGFTPSDCFVAIQDEKTDNLLDETVLLEKLKEIPTLYQLYFCWLIVRNYLETLFPPNTMLCTQCGKFNFSRETTCGCKVSLNQNSILEQLFLCRNDFLKKKHIQKRNQKPDKFFKFHYDYLSKEFAITSPMELLGEGLSSCNLLEYLRAIQMINERHYANHAPIPIYYSKQFNLQYINDMVGATFNSADRFDYILGNDYYRAPSFCLYVVDKVIQFINAAFYEALFGDIGSKQLVQVFKNLCEANTEKTEFPIVSFLKEKAGNCPLLLVYRPIDEPGINFLCAEDWSFNTTQRKNANKCLFIPIECRRLFVPNLEVPTQENVHDILSEQYIIDNTQESLLNPQGKIKREYIEEIEILLKLLANLTHHEMTLNTYHSDVIFHHSINCDSGHSINEYFPNHRVAETENGLLQVIPKRWEITNHYQQSTEIKEKVTILETLACDPETIISELPREIRHQIYNAL